MKRGLYLILLLLANNIFAQAPCLPETEYNYADLPLPDFWKTDLVQNSNNTPADNLLTDAGATLGRVLFYDKNLSKDHSTSCGSCHLQEKAFADQGTFSFGVDGHMTTRNSMGLVNLAYYPNGRMFWDERVGSIEEQIQATLDNPFELGKDISAMIADLEGTDYYPDLFDKAFDSPEITEDKIVKAIAQFVRSIVSYRSKYDEGRDMIPLEADPRFLDFPNFSAKENLGKELYFQEDGGNCGSCHLTDLFLSFEPFNNGLDLVYEDNGIGTLTGNETEMGLFKSPSLRNIEKTAPYMHDGRFGTIREVIEFYRDKVQAHPNLSPQLIDHSTGKPQDLDLSSEEKQSLVAFLETLTDEEMLIDEKWSDPFCAPTGNADQALTSVRVYPNPSADFIYVDNKQELTSFIVYSPRGEVLYQTDQVPSSISLKTLKVQTFCIIEMKSRHGSKLQKLILTAD